MTQRIAGRAVAVIGAGLSGITAGESLRRAGLRVEVFDKARGPGGRASTRRSPTGGFDHGAQYFTARDPAFVVQTRLWQAAGVVAPWVARIPTLSGGAIGKPAAAQDRFVGVPRMSAWLRHLSRDLALACGRRVVRVARSDDGFVIGFDAGADRGPFDAVVVATPAPQAVPLLATASALAARVASAEVDPCWAVLLAFAAALPLPFDAAFVQDSPLAWLAREGSKPGRAAGERVVLHATPAWSATHVDTSPEEVVNALRDAFGLATGVSLPAPVESVAHRWLYARTRRPLGEPYLLDEAGTIGVCGDYCLGDRIENAWQSGHALAQAMLSRLGVG